MSAPLPLENICYVTAVSSHFAQSHFAQWDRVRGVGVRVRRWDWAKWGRTVTACRPSIDL